MIRARRSGRQRRQPYLGYEPLESRLVMAAGWNNALNPLNVSGHADGLVSPIDALLIINELNRPTVMQPETGALINERPEGYGFLDVDCDGYASPVDVVRVLNWLNEPTPLVERRTGALTNAFFPSWQVVESGGSADGHGSVTSELCGATLREGDSYSLAIEAPFRVPNSPTALRFTFDQLSFDTSSPAFVNDALEIAMLDPEGNPLGKTFAPGRDAAFNVTEGEAASFSDGVSADGHQVYVGLNGLPAGMSGKLVVRLVNNDSDTNTSVRLTDVALVPSDLRIASPEGLFSRRSAVLAEQSQRDLASTINAYDQERAVASAHSERRDLLPGQTAENIVTITADSPRAKAKIGSVLTSFGRLGIRGDIPAGLQVSHITANGNAVDAVDVSGNFFYSWQVQPGDNDIRFAGYLSDGRSIETVLNIVGIPQDGHETEISFLDDVTATMTGIYGRTSLDEQQQTLHVELTNRNSSLFSVAMPLVVAVAHLSRADVIPLSPDGYLADGTPYYHVNSSEANRTLSPGESSDLVTLSFFNPSGEHFDFDLVYWGTLNTPPAITSIPTLDAVVDVAYAYNVTAVDLEHDVLTYRLTEAPAAAKIDDSGRIQWRPTLADVGNHQIRIAVDDGHGGIANQAFTISVTPPPPNRPPLITSVPATVTDATPFAPDPLPIVFDSDTWSIVQYPFGTQGDASWSFNFDKTIATQSRNADASILLSNVPLLDQRIQGHWKAGQSNDDDFMGFVFGYQDSQHYYLFDWKRADQQDHQRKPLGFAERGMSIKVVDANTLPTEFDLWPTIGSPGRVTTLYHNKIPYEINKQYTFDLEFHAGHFQVVISDGGTVLDTIAINDDTYANGQFGFYNYSQDSIEYTGFTRQQIAPVQYKYDVEAIDADNDRLAYQLLEKPLGMAINPQTGVISWSPTPRQMGMHSVEVAVSDNHGGVTTQHYEMCVRELTTEAPSSAQNTAPLFTNAPLREVSAGQRLSISIETQDAEEDLVTMHLVEAPAAMVIAETEVRNPMGLVVGMSRRLVWSVPAELIGTTQHFAIRADDGHGGTTSQTWELSVTSAAAVNHPPTIRPIDQLRIARQQLWNVMVRARDEDGDALTYSLLDTPNGMSISEIGQLTWTASADAPALVTGQIVVEDGRGGRTIQAFQLAVEDHLQNGSPAIVSSPAPRAVVAMPYVYDLRSIDPNGDAAVWTLLSGPQGMSLDGQTGALRWTPSSDQLGVSSVGVAATDPWGGTTTQAFDIEVGCTNRGPAIVSVPRTLTVAQQPYIYAARANDAERDPLTWRLLRAPQGMTIDANSGVVQWSPGLPQVGVQGVTIEVSDATSRSTQAFDLVVRRTNELVDPRDPSLGTLGNHAPVIVSEPRGATEEGRLYNYQILAVDADGDRLTYALDGHVPAGMNVDDKGLVSWTPGSTQIGNVLISVIVTDSQGAQAAQQFLLDVSTNAAPTIVSVPTTSLTAGAVYRYTVRANDPDGDPLSYSLNDAPVGMTIDERGRLLWPTNVNDRGSYAVNVKVADDHGHVISHDWQIQLNADTVPPAVSIVILPSSVNSEAHAVIDLNSEYRVHVRATDNVGLNRVALYVNEVLTPLDSNETVTLLANTKGLVSLRATATDDAGLEGQALGSVTVVDAAEHNRPVPTDPSLPLHPGLAPDDKQRPIVMITSPQPGTKVTTATPILGTVDDPEDNLWYFRVYSAKVDRVSLTSFDLSDPDWTILNQGTQEVINGELGVFDPSLNGNDPYAIAVAAFDVNGNGYVQPTIVYVEGHVQLGNFRLEFTDLNIPLAGIPIEITRVYDTAQTTIEGDFGFGWSLGVQDARILEVAALGEGGALNPGNDKFVPDKTKVYLTTPSGQRVGFTYKEEYLSGAAFLLGCTFGCFFRPYFEPDSGVYDTLSIDETRVSRGGILAAFDQGINPDLYTLTTKDGLKYRYSESAGLQTITDRNGNVVTFSENGVTHSSGESIQFQRDHRGRIQRIVDPAGNVLHYEYDAVGDLRTFTTQVGTTTQYGYRSDPAHFLDEAIDAQGNRALKAVYEPSDLTGELEFKGVINAMGNRVDNRDFDVLGRTGIVRDGNGNATTLIYNERGNVLQETDASGNVTIREYSDLRNPDSETKIIDRRGFVTEQQFDARGNLLKVLKIGPQNAPFDEPIVTSFTYNVNNDVTSVTDANGHTTTFRYEGANLVEIRNALGNVASMSYFTNGDVRSFTDFNGNTTQFSDYVGGQPRLITYADGTQQKLEYNQFGQITYEAYLEANGTIAQERRSVYDKAGRLIEELTGSDVDGSKTVRKLFYDGNLLDWEILVHPDSLDAQGNLLETPATPVALRKSSITDYVYDVGGRVISQIDAEGGVIDFRYDAQGNRVALRDPVGNITTWVYDVLNRPVEERDAIYWNDLRNRDVALANLTEDEFFGLVAPVAPGSVADPLYDTPSGASCEQGKSASHVTLTCYDEEGNQAFVIDRNGRRQEFEYDFDDNLLLEQLFDEQGVFVRSLANEYDRVGNRTSEKDGLGNITRHTFDSLGHLTTTIDALGGRTEREYDDAGNLAAVLDANGHRTSLQYDTRGRLSRQTDAAGFSQVFSYDAAGNQSSVIDQKGETTRWTYDLAGRLRSVIDAAAGVTSNGYDVMGNLATITNPLGNVTSYAYDRNGRLIRETDAEGGIVAYEYDKAGNRTALVDQVSNRSTFQYDPLGRLATEIDPLEHSIVFAYDGVGNQIESIDRNGRRRTFAYDAMDQVISETWWEGNQALRVVESNYDANGNLLSISDPDSRYAFGYDSLDRQLTADNSGTPNLPQIILTSEYDAVGNRVKVFDSSGVTVESTYDRRNLLASRKWQGGGVSPARADFGYDERGGQISQARFGDLNGVLPVGNTTVSLDALGRVSEILHIAKGSPVASYSYGYDAASRLNREVRNGNAIDYGYDRTDQLKQADRSTGPDEEYSFDSAGNRTLDGYATSAGNRLTSGGSFTYAYDNEGNLVQKTHLASGNITAYAYDYRNRLIAVTERNAAGIILTDVRYVYDALNRMISRTTNGVTRFTIHDGDATWADYDATGGVSARYLVGDRIDDMIARWRPGEGTAWYLTDKLGTVREVLDETGELLNRIDYDSFGRIVSQSKAAAGDRFTYTGRELDTATGLYYYRARFYDPVVGRFNSEDPIRFDAGDGNLFRYVQNSPLVGTDPSGMLSAIEFRTIAATALTGAFIVSLFSVACGTGEAVVTHRAVTIDETVELITSGGIAGALLGAAVGLGIATAPLVVVSGLAGAYYVSQSETFEQFAIRTVCATSGGALSRPALAVLTKIARPARNPSWFIPRTVTEKLPPDWHSQPNAKKVGTRWSDPANPGNGVRIDQGTPGHSMPSQRVDHVIVRRNGQVIGRDGKPISGSVRDDFENAHIPLNEYVNWSKWYAPD